MTYRPAPQDQILLLPPCLEDLIGEKDLCRVVNAFVEALPRSNVEERFRHPSGAPAFHPRMMLKVLLYACTQRLYSSRRIARALERDVHFMWLAASLRPSHNTINRFRGDYLADVLPAAFAALAEMLLKQKYIRQEEYFTDGTVMEANANKHTYVWGKNTRRFKERVEERAREILEEAERTDREEDALYGSGDLPEKGEQSSIRSSDIEAAARSLAESGDERKRKAAKALEKEAQNLRKYEEQEEKLAGRNSYSKTDPDATFMYTKDGRLAPAYNAQAGTQDGFITGVSVNQNPNDAVGFIAHLESRAALDLPPPPAVVADAIYGTEENYAHLEAHGIESYLKYPAWHRENTGQTRPYEKSAFTFEEAHDRFLCPQNRPLTFVEERTEKTPSGYEKTYRLYACANCGDCPVRDLCVTKGSGNRYLRHSPVLNRYQSETRERLKSDRGVELRRRRAPEIETVFGHIKHNLGIRRFLLRGLRKVRTEWTWIALGYNLTRLLGRLNASPAPWNADQLFPPRALKAA